MQRRTTDILLVAATVAVLGLAALWSGGAFRPSRVRLDEAIRLARIQRFDDAEREVREYLRTKPADVQARLLAAQVVLQQADPQPREALEFLGDLTPKPDPLGAQFCLFRGKAHYYRGDYATAESEWLKALELDPTVPEAGWALLDLYYVQGRGHDATVLAHKLRATEPDPRDQILLLLELVRAEARQLAAPIVISRLERALETNPADLESSIGLGRALIRDSQIEKGLARLQDVVEHVPKHVEAWDALLAGLDDAGRNAEFAATLARIPREIGDDPAFFKHRGRLKQNEMAWKDAADLYRKSLAFRADQPTVAYRLSRVLRTAGADKEAAVVEQSVRDFETAANEIGALYEEADAIKSHGIEPQPKLYGRLATICEKLGRKDQATAWHELEMRSDLGNADRQQAAKRLRDARGIKN